MRPRGGLQRVERSRGGTIATVSYHTESPLLATFIAGDAGG